MHKEPIFVADDGTDVFTVDGFNWVLVTIQSKEPPFDCRMVLLDAAGQRRLVEALEAHLRASEGANEGDHEEEVC